MASAVDFGLVLGIFPMRLCVRFCFSLYYAACVRSAAVRSGPGANPAMLKAKAENVPAIPYESVPNLLKLPPNLYLGEGIGVATNSKGHVFVYTRSQRTRLFEFDQRGNYVREIGEGLYGFVFAHAVRVDSQDNIWAVDEGSNMVIKFNPEGRVLMTMGRRPEPTECAGRRPAGPVPPPIPASTSSIAPPTSDGTPPATSSSPMATATRAS